MLRLALTFDLLGMDVDDVHEAEYSERDQGHAPRADNDPINSGLSGLAGVGLAGGGLVGFNLEGFDWHACSFIAASPFCKIARQDLMATRQLAASSVWNRAERVMGVC
jgi:hypothetical protein